MRVLFDKKRSTKAERIFHELLKRNRIPFKAKVKIRGREVDFLIGKLIVEIGNHSQDLDKNKLLLESGYSTLFVTNDHLRKDREAIEAYLLKTLSWHK